uniref:Uncharacterized protein n=1 Tax=Apteryx owenii TaxID=8824 RepID=A0A8B9PA68_APTOW
MAKLQCLQADCVFRGGEHAVRMAVNGDALEVEVEDRLTTDQWRGEFDAAFIEDLTHKTGNFKQFGIFCSMLESALTQAAADAGGEAGGGVGGAGPAGGGAPGRQELRRQGGEGAEEDRAEPRGRAAARENQAPASGQQAPAGEPAAGQRAGGGEGVGEDPADPRQEPHRRAGLVQEGVSRPLSRPLCCFRGPPQPPRGRKGARSFTGRSRETFGEQNEGFCGGAESLQAARRQGERRGRVPPAL